MKEHISYQRVHTEYLVGHTGNCDREEFWVMSEHSTEEQARFVLNKHKEDLIKEQFKPSLCICKKTVVTMHELIPD